MRVFFTVTPLLISLQWLLDKLGLPGWGFIACNYYRVLCRLLRIRVRVVGEPVRDRAVLFVSNHVSWVDILVIGSIAPVAFVAKREVASWPLVGITAQTAAHGVRRPHAPPPDRDAIGEIVQRLAAGTSVVLFAEGTSSDGNRVLPFRSALVGAVRARQARSAERGILIQPMSICYTGLHGIPMGRQHRPLVAWYGDLDFMPHIKALHRARRGRRGGQLRRAGPGRRRGRPQGDDEDAGGRGAGLTVGGAARPAAPGRLPASVLKSS